MEGWREGEGDEQPLAHSRPSGNDSSVRAGWFGFCPLLPCPDSPTRLGAPRGQGPWHPAQGLAPSRCSGNSRPLPPSRSKPTVWSQNRGEQHPSGNRITLIFLRTCSEGPSCPWVPSALPEGVAGCQHPLRLLCAGHQRALSHLLTHSHLLTLAVGFNTNTNRNSRANARPA